MATIYLVRHGNTDWTGQRINGNTPGVHLNETGRSQAERIAGYLCQFPIEAIFSSPMERATETADPLARQINTAVTPKEFLREINFGDFQGLGVELAGSPVWQQFLTHPAEVIFPGGESIKAAQERVATGLNELSARFAGEAQITCFAHCEILRLAIAHVLKMPLDDYMRITIDPASISCVEWTVDFQCLKMLNSFPK
jgi:broad specificity phosphatase PhoE